MFGTVRNRAKAQAIPGDALIEMDVCDETSVKNGILTIIAQAKRIDVLVNSAGVTLLGATEETSIAEAQTLFDTNLFGLLRMTKAVLPHMRAKGWGRIISTGSAHSLVASPNKSAYIMAKHGLAGLTKALALAGEMSVSWLALSWVFSRAGSRSLPLKWPR